MPVAEPIDAMDPATAPAAAPLRTPRLAAARSPSRTGRRVVLALVFLVALAAWCEMYARLGLLYWRGAPRPLQPFSRRVLHPDPAFVPGVSPRARFSATWRGLRDDGTAQSRAGAPEILAIGSSTIECIYLDEAEAFPAQIGAAVSAKVGRTVSVGAGAKSGLLAWHCARYCEDLPGRIPSIRCVVAMPGANELNQWLRAGRPAHALSGVIADSSETAAASRAAGPARRITPVMRNALYTWPYDPGHALARIACADRFYALVRGQAAALARSISQRFPVRFGQSEINIDDTGESYANCRRYRSSAALIGVPPEMLPALEDSLAFFRADLVDMCRSAALHGVDLVLVTQPLLYSDDMTAAARALWWNGAIGPTRADTHEYLTEKAYRDCLERYNEVTRSVAAEHGAILVDLSACMTDGQGRCFYDTLHFNNAGAAFAGRVVGEIIAQRVPFPRE